MSERFQVDPGGVQQVAVERSWTVVVFPDEAGRFVDLVGLPLAEGHPEISVLADVRHL
jgi:hypothetical protein